MFTTNKNGTNFFRPYREQLQDSEHYNYQYNQNHSPNTKYLERSPLRYSHTGFDYNYNQDPQTHYKRMKTSFDSPSKYGRYSRSPSKKYMNQNQQLQKHKYGRDRQMNEPAWQYLYSKGLQKRKYLDEQYQKKKNKIDMECTFQPMIRKTNRYLVPQQSNFLERNRIWNDNRIQKIVKQKQQEVTKGLEDCTFKPKLNSYYKFKNKESPKKYSIHSNCKSRRKMAKDESNRTLNQQNQSAKKNSDLNREQVGKIKNLIRKQLKRIEL